jgi:hypothetical protein
MQVRVVDSGDERKEVSGCTVNDVCETRVVMSVTVRIIDAPSPI